MQLDVEPKDLGPVVQLVAKADGWKLEETRYNLLTKYIGGDPKPSVTDITPSYLREPLQAAWLKT